MKKALVATTALAVAGAIVFGIVYGAEKNSDGGSSSGLAEHGGLLGVAGELDEHAGTMRQHGEEMSVAGQEAGNQHWVDQGVELLSSARQMESIADQLRGTSRDLALFPMHDPVNVYRLRGDGNALVRAGQALVEHADGLEAEANSMISEAEAADMGDMREGAELLRSDAADIAEHGHSVVRAGQPILDQADRLEASLGH